MNIMGQKFKIFASFFMDELLMKLPWIVKFRSLLLCILEKKKKSCNFYILAVIHISLTPEI